jgi:hypothetical protein
LGRSAGVKICADVISTLVQRENRIRARRKILPGRGDKFNTMVVSFS